MFPSDIVARATRIAVILAVAVAVIDGVGVNWGTLMSHPMDPAIVVQMLKPNRINKVKLFDADPWTVNALARTGIEVMLAIPNDHLGDISSKYKNAKDWVKQNVIKYDHRDGVDIKYDFGPRYLRNLCQNLMLFFSFFFLKQKPPNHIWNIHLRNCSNQTGQF